MSLLKVDWYPEQITADYVVISSYNTEDKKKYGANKNNNNFGSCLELSAINPFHSSSE